MYPLSTYSVPGIVLSTWNTFVNERCSPHEADCLGMGHPSGCGYFVLIYILNYEMF